MARNGSGTYSLPEAAFVYDTVISETAVNSNFSDIATALTGSLTKDGQTTPTANLPMGTYKHTGLGSGSAATDSANLGQVQAQAYTWCGTASGTTNALTLSPTPAITAYAVGQSFRAIIGAADTTTAVTVAVSGLATKAVEINGAACSATAFLQTSKLYQFDYDGTAFQATRLSDATQLNLTTAAIGVSVQAYDADTLKADTTDTLTVGFTGTSANLGNLNSATTLSIATSNIQYATMTGSFTLTAPNDAADGYLELEMTIDATGGYTLTLSGFNQISGTFDATANVVNVLRISKLNTNTYLEIIQAV